MDIRRNTGVDIMSLSDYINPPEDIAQALTDLYKNKTDKIHNNWNNCSRCQRSFDNAKKNGKISRRIEEEEEE